MKILMYGWEFPPRISGGLGVACHAIVQELAHQQHDITMVLPYATDNLIDHQRVTIIGCDTIASHVSSIAKLMHANWHDLTSLKKFFTALNPYLRLTQSEYLAKLDDASSVATQIIAQLKTLINCTSLAELATLRPTNVGAANYNYGMNLLAEVCHYAVVAGTLATVAPHVVIHAHDWLTVLAGIEAKKHSGKPLVFHVHALESDRSGDLVDTRIFAIEKYGMEQADKIVAVSQYTKNNIVKKYGIPANKITVVHNGACRKKLSTSHKNVRKHGKMVLFLGRLAHQKGPFAFINAARKILEKRRDVHFVIVGSGGLWEEMIHYVAGSRLGKHIHFIGFLDHEKIDQIFRLTDVYVMPSISEPFGLTCLEALAYDVPVVISKQSGAAEALPHAIKVDFWDVDEMANKIVALLDYVPLRKITLQQAGEELKSLTWEKTARSLISLYEYVVARSVSDEAIS